MAYALYGHDNMDWEQVISKFCWQHRTPCVRMT
jgi:hypothetical protein